MSEGPDGLETVVSGEVGRPSRGEAVGLFEHRLGVAKAEMRGVADAHRKQIGWVGIEQVAPHSERVPECAALPGGECRDVALFAR